mgnify:CR=1 FL=1
MRTHLGVVGGGDPQAQHVSTEGRLLLLVAAALDDLHGVDDVAERLGHLVPLLVEHEAVRQHLVRVRVKGQGFRLGLGVARG